MIYKHFANQLKRKMNHYICNNTNQIKSSFKIQIKTKNDVLKWIKCKNAILSDQIILMKVAVWPVSDGPVWGCSPQPGRSAGTSLWQLRCLRIWGSQRWRPHGPASPCPLSSDCPADIHSRERQVLVNKPPQETRLHLFRAASSGNSKLTRPLSIAESFAVII